MSSRVGSRQSVAMSARKMASPTTIEVNSRGRILMMRPAGGGGCGAGAVGGAAVVRPKFPRGRSPPRFPAGKGHAKHPGPFVALIKKFRQVDEDQARRRRPHFRVGRYRLACCQ